MYCITILLQLDQQGSDSVASKTRDFQRTKTALFGLDRGIRVRLGTLPCTLPIVHVQLHLQRSNVPYCHHKKLRCEHKTSKELFDHGTARSGHC